MSKVSIGVVSDTHMSEFNDELLFLNEEVFKDAKIVVHCGDMERRHVLDAFYDKEIVAVCGNMDNNNVKLSYPHINQFEAIGYKFIVTHGIGYGNGLYKNLVSQFPDTSIFLHGHTHIPVMKKLDNYYFFNPGSFSHNRVDFPTRSAGIIELEKGCEPVFKIIDLQNIKKFKFKIIEVVNEQSTKRD